MVRGVSGGEVSSIWHTWLPTKGILSDSCTFVAFFLLSLCLRMAYIYNLLEYLITRYSETLIWSISRHKIALQYPMNIQWIFIWTESMLRYLIIQYSRRLIYSILKLKFYKNIQWISTWRRYMSAELFFLFSKNYFFSHNSIFENNNALFRDIRTSDECININWIEFFFSLTHNNFIFKTILFVYFAVLLSYNIVKVQQIFIKIISQKMKWRLCIGSPKRIPPKKEINI